jgi:hypothetical protein
MRFRREIPSTSCATLGPKSRSICRQALFHAAPARQRAGREPRIGVELETGNDQRDAQRMTPDILATAQVRSP